MVFILAQNYNKFYSSILYFSNKYITLTNIALLYLFLSPFYIHTQFLQHNIIKNIISGILANLIIFLFIIKRITHFNFRFRVNSYLGILFVFFSLAFISTIVTLDKFKYSGLFHGSSSTHRIVTVLGILIPMYLCYLIIDLESFFTLIKVFYYSFFVAAIGVFWNILYAQTIYGNLFPRLTSFMHDPNIFGHYCTLIILLSYLFFIKTKQSDILLRIKYFVIGLTALIFLSFTFSRGSFVIFLLFTGILFFAIDIKKNKRLILALFFVFCTAFMFQYLKRLEKEDVSGSFNVSDFNRISTNLAAVNMIKDNFIFGVGYENARYLLKKYQNKKIPLVEHMDSVHNVFLRIFAELGVLGFILFLTFTVLCFKESLLLVRKEVFPNNIIYIFTLCIVVSYIFHGLIYHYYFNRHIYWTLLLICLLSFRYKDQIPYKLQTFML